MIGSPVHRYIIRTLRDNILVADASAARFQCFLHLNPRVSTTTFQIAGSIRTAETSETWSAGDIGSAVKFRSRYLANEGIGHGDRVIIAHGGTAAFFVDLFATWSRGACAVCINPAMPQSERSRLERRVSPALQLQQGIMLSHSNDSQHETITARSDDPALVLFTSGSTGEPKGVVLSFASIAARAKLNRRYLGDDVLAKTLCTLPTHFGHGLIGNCLTPLLAGCELTLMRGDAIALTSRFGTVLSEYPYTFMSSVPGFWKMALRLSAPPQRCHLLQIGIGSAPVSAELINSVQRWSGAKGVRNLYGITEAANWVAGSNAVNSDPGNSAVGCMWGGRAAVMTNGKILPHGAGELLIKSPALMSGYLDQPLLNAEKFVDGWYKTGDLCLLARSGTIVLTGRLGSEINRAGIKVSPEEIDLLLERHPQVEEACAFAEPDEFAGELTGVAVQLSSFATVDSNALNLYCRQNIRPESVPDRWYFIDNIPKNERGKVNRDVVKALCLSQKST